MRSLVMCIAVGAAIWLPMGSSMSAQEEPIVALQDEGGGFEHSFDGPELPQYTLVESFYRRVIQRATVGLKRPSSWAAFRQQLGIQQDSAEEEALLQATWKAQELFERQLLDPALEGIEAEQYQLARIREQARDLARIHKQLLSTLKSENEGESARHLEKYIESDVRPAVRLLGTDSTELSQYLEAVKEFDREMQIGEGS